MDHFMDGASADFEVLSLGAQMFVLTALPVAIGMGSGPTGLKRPMPWRVALARWRLGLFVIIVLAAIASEWDTLMDNIGTLGPAVVGLNIIMLTIGYQKLLDLEAVRATTVAIESGIQNASVGITVGGLIMAPAAGETLSTLSLPSGVYGGSDVPRDSALPLLEEMLQWRTASSAQSSKTSVSALRLTSSQ